MIYAYRCEGCGEAFTVRATVAEKAQGLDPPCPQCGRRGASQDFSGVGVVRGGGTAAAVPFCGPGARAGCC